ncbi:MAG: hypothetical protein ACXW1D_00220 [Halobacteriota archaeon]
MCAGNTLAQTDTQCLRYAVWKEARGEGILTQRAVLDVIHHRMEKSGKGACHVIKKPGQFPYAKYGIKPVAYWFKDRYNILLGVKPVLSKDYLYFNHVKHPWCKGTRKIGGMYFCK